MNDKEMKSSCCGAGLIEDEDFRIISCEMCSRIFRLKDLHKLAIAKQQVEEFQQSLKQKIEEMGGDFPYMPEEVRICSSKERGRYCNTCNRSWSECVCKERSMGYRKCKRDILDLFSPDQVDNS